MYFSYFILCTVLFSASSAKYPSRGDELSFQPSANRYYETNLPSPNNNTNQYESKSSKESSKLSRFGLPSISYGSTGSGVYGGGNGGNVGYMVTPMKVDIGGIALGALLGLGAILFVPKLATLFGGGHGYRSIEDNMSSVSNLLSRIDNTLEQNNIDSSSCMQRIICSYVNEAQRNMQNGEGSTVDQLIVDLTGNPIFSYMVDGSAIKQAVDMGKQGDAEKCASLYSKCPISKENVVKVIASLLPA